MGRNEFLAMADQARAMSKGSSPAAADALERIASDFRSMAGKRRRNIPRVAAVIAALFAVYFPAAFLLQRDYVDVAPKGRIVFQITGPFSRYNHASIPYQTGLDLFNSLGNDVQIEGDQRSPLMLYENSKPLGPAHSTFHDISHLGGGRFSHLKDNQFVFSSSDNSDPNENKRSYWVVLP